MSVRRIVAVLILGSVVGSPVAFASDGRHELKREERPRLKMADPAPVHLLGSWLHRAISKAGCVIDPAGIGCVPIQGGTSPQQSGRTNSQPSGAGCMLDPLGCSVSK
jgi:hypothetical protein